MSYLPGAATVSRHADQEVAGRTRFVATGAQTQGDFGLFEVTLPPGGGGPGPHVHRTFSESFHVLEGRLAVLDGDTWTTAGPGDLVYVPRSGVHGFRAADDDAGCRFLILFTPGAPREDYFRGMVELRAGGRVPTTEELDELAARYDQLNLRD
ncbi:Cupin domain protein [Klenkia marina]|uniref:Cupin domain protein n=1 Tax=Klenkia marina TaxID=1960309 RepID=A0A1G4Z0B3_9ACTN|nr:cupin domain-containing protein [Klenkia marina]SCX59104.1 Cupin domain protein [Klenkia marina]